MSKCPSYSAQLGIDRLIGGFKIVLPNSFRHDTAELQDVLRNSFCGNFEDEGRSFSLRLYSSAKQGKPTKSLQRDYLRIPKKFYPSEAPYLLLQSDLSVIREAAFLESSSMMACDRLRLEDFIASLGNDNKLPLNSISPRVDSRRFLSRQWKIVESVESRLSSSLSQVLATFAEKWSEHELTTHPYLEQLEVAQDIYFKACTSSFVFERMSFIAGLIQDRLIRIGDEPVRYPRALTEFDFARSPVKRMPNRRSIKFRKRLVELRTSQGYSVRAVTRWAEQHALATVYFTSPLNQKKLNLPELIPIHGYTKLPMPDGTIADLFRVEPRFRNRAGMSGGSLFNLVKTLFMGARNLLPLESDFALIETQRPMLVHRLCYSACMAAGLSEENYRGLIKGGAVRIGKRDPDFGKFAHCFEVRKRLK